MRVRVVGPCLLYILGNAVTLEDEHLNHHLAGQEPAGAGANKTETVEREHLRLRHDTPRFQRVHRESILLPGAGSVSWWGSAKYEQQLRSWAELVRDQDHLGNDCDAAAATETCGMQYVCRKGHCAVCQKDKECERKHTCLATESGNLCVPRDLIAHWSWGHTVCSIVIVFAAMLSAAAGMGGGGIYVPLFLLLLGLSAKEAVPLSQSLIVGGAIVNFILFSGEAHPRYVDKSKIDYDVIMMMNPGLAAGVMLGVIVHVMSPQWFIVFCLLITLGITLWKSGEKGVKLWKKEGDMIAAGHDLRPSNSGDMTLVGGIKMKVIGLPKFMRYAIDNARAIILISSLWVLFFVYNMLHLTPCTASYWAGVTGMLAICGLFTYAGGQELLQRPKEEREGLVEWGPTEVWQYPIWAAVAGFMGGLLGIGGGIIMGPLLLELGLAPEASQATNATFVLLSSSLASLQFLVMGATMPAFVIFFTSLVVISTLLGQTIIEYLMKKSGRSSPIVLSIAGVIAVSTVLLTITGTMDVLHDISHGNEMGFLPGKLCAGH